MTTSEARGPRVARALFASGLLVAAAALLPLPRGCDAREVVPPELPADEYAKLLRHANTHTRAEIEAAFRLVDPESGLAAHYTLDDQVLSIRREPGEAPVRIALRSEPRATPRSPGARDRIALDPGHFGGAWSVRENRHIVQAGGQPVREGDLSWATTRLIADDLKRAGKTVALTRDPPPAAPYPAFADPGFDLEREAAYRLVEQRPHVFPWLTPLNAIRLVAARRDLVNETPFELYQRFDLRRRAAVATAFAADVTLSLHFNTTENDGNGIVVFVPGNFLPEDFATATQRYWAFARVLDGTLMESTRLARALAAAMMKHLKLPALGREDDHTTGGYWRAIDREHGVYARNLAILRRTAGIVLLLEGPCVNQTEEYQRLQATDLLIDGRPHPQRLRAYADAVVEGLTRDETSLSRR
ncbi:MAG TPA: N-acetylmuramoyl-L-alanine amidase [Polyangia bacterium]